MKELLSAINGEWQIPIYTSKGDFIVWSSALVHSAKFQDFPEEATLDDVWKGWRGVIYICYRPKEEFTQEEIANRSSVIENNRTTNHWGLKIFDNNPSKAEVDYCDTIKKYIDDPSLIYSIENLAPNLTDDQKKLAGLI